MDTKALKQKILDLAIHGRLVPQDPNDEPASVLLQRIREEKLRLAQKGKIKKKSKGTEEPAQAEDAPFEVPEGWVWCRLVDSCHIAGRIGFRGYAKDDLVGEQEGAITLSPSNITDGHMDYTKCTYISWHKYEESPEIQVNNGDILLVKTGSSYGKCALVGDLPWKATINPQFVVLKYISINPQYLTWILQSSYARKNYDAFVLGTAIPTFTQVVLGNLRIPLPPLTEQRRIVAEIERWFGLIDIIESGKTGLKSAVKQAKAKILDLAIHGRLMPQDPNDEPASTLLQRINPKAEIVEDNDEYGDVPEGWCVCHINDIADSLLGKTLDKSKDQGELKKYLCAINVQWGYFDLTTQKEFRIEDRELDRYAVKNGDLLVCEGGDVGRSAIWNGNSEMYYQNALHRIRCKQCVSAEYLLYALWHFKLSGTIDDLCKGVTIKHFTQSAMNKLAIPLPPLPEQHRIVAKLEELFVLLDKIESSL